MLNNLRQDTSNWLDDVFKKKAQKFLAKTVDDAWEERMYD